MNTIVTVESNWYHVLLGNTIVTDEGNWYHVVLGNTIEFSVNCVCKDEMVQVYDEVKNITAPRV